MIFFVSVVAVNRVGVSRPNNAVCLTPNLVLARE